MKGKYSINPNKDVFMAFLHARNFNDEDLAVLEQMTPVQVIVDRDLNSWTIEYKALVNLPECLLAAVAEELTAACSLSKVELVCAADIDAKNISYLEQKEAIIAKISNYCSEAGPILRGALWAQDGNKLLIAVMGEALLQFLQSKQLEKKLRTVLLEEYGIMNPLIEFSTTEVECNYDEAPLTEEYIAAVEASSGEHKKTSKDGILFGKKVTGNVRKLHEIHEEENRITVEGTIVSIEERELRTGAVILKFGIKDDTDGLIIKMRFGEAKGEGALANNMKACLAIKALLKQGASIRLCGNVSPDRYEHDEMVMFNPQGIMKIEKAVRMDEAPIKRIEFHCHTKMSKMDAVTPIKELMQTALKWGHKALAITDHGVVQAFPFAYDEVEAKDFKLIFGVEGYLVPYEQITTAKTKQYHIIILAKNPEGLRNLYRLISISHLKYFLRRPRLHRDLINEYRKGLIVGSACEAGELFQAILMNKPEEEIIEIANFYDYLEIQPTGNNNFLIRDNRYPHINSVKDLEELNRKIYLLGKKLNKLTIATCDVHFLNPEDEVLRRILQAGMGFGDADQQAPLYFRTTDEMLREFQYLGKEAAYEVVVTNPNLINEQIEKFKPIPDRDQLYSPQIPGAERKIKEMSYQRAHEWYGESLPKIVEDRLNMELNSIIGHGFAVLYYIAHKLVKKSLDDGYLVGSRGSVGSSFVATMIDITEVNPLKPHYRCPQCKYSEFIEDNSVSSGFDLEQKACPHCNTDMIRDGHDIPFAVFMGFHGDKVPDIDLNFSGVYQPNAHKYTEDLFGRDNVCRAGTIATVADKTAYGYVKKYFEGKGIEVRNAFIEGMINGFAGIKRTTGQHPGGIMVVPRDMDIHYITPMQHPADDPNSDTITTHYDYHSINDRLVKLDILGHDDPTVIRMLEDLTKVPAKSIPFNDKDTMELFSSTKSLGVTPEQINSNVGTFGIPECGTQFVRQMIQDVQPKNFSAVVRVSGYSHGTNVWLNNAQDLIRSGIPSSETISTRDDVMTSLIAKGVDPSISFKIMEDVRKGKAAKSGLKPEYLAAMKAANVPDWYIKSCNTVEYLFPKAHAVAYVMMAYRIAYCKVHYPKEFYAAYFTVRAPKFDAALVIQGVDFMKKYVKEIYAQGNAAKVNDKDTVTYLELAIEMIYRGFQFEKIDLYRSDPHKFLVTEKGLLPPLGALAGIGDSAADNIAEARRGRPFISKEDLRNRAKVPKSAIEALTLQGSLDGLPDTDQIDLFG